MVVRFPYRSGSGTATVSTFAFQTRRAVDAVNGTFFDSTGPSSFMKDGALFTYGNAPYQGGANY